MIYFFDINLKLKKIVTPENALEAVHEHELNNHILGSVTLDMAYAKQFIDDVDHFGYYYKGNFYLHRIKRVEDSHISETVTVTGRHIFFEDMLYGLPIDDFRPQNRDAAYILKNTIDTNTRWRTVMTDVTGTLSTNFYRQVPYDVIEWVVENFRVEFEPVILFDGQKINGYQLHVANKLGMNKHKRIPFSRVTELDYEIDYNEIITSLAGYGKGEEVGDGHGRRINIADVDFSRNGVVSPIGSHYMEDTNITALYGKDNGEPKYAVDDESFTDIEDPVVLADAMYESYLEMSRPKMAFSASVIDVGDVAIGDTQVIVRPEYDVFYSVRIHKMVVNLHESEDSDVELGDYAHFKESKVERKSRQADKAWKKRYASAIEQMQRDWDADYEGIKAQINSAYEQAVIDANAEIDAAEVRMQDELDTQRQQMTENINTARDTAIEQAEADAAAKADAVQGNLKSFEQTHQQLYDEVTGDIMDIDTFLGDKTVTLAQQFADVESDFSGLQTELIGVSDDLGVAKTNLQQQLDDAKASIEGIEVGGRNLFSARKFTEGNKYSYDVDDSGRLIIKNVDGTGSSSYKKIADLKPNTNYVFHFSHRMNDRFDILDIEGTRNGMVPGSKQWNDENTVMKFKTTENATAIQGKFYLVDGYNLEYPETVKIQIESGTIPTDYQPAPEDTEAKITTLNQQIEFIEGELSAKLERTDIEPINNKITEYEANFEVSAQNFATLFEKTELHDGNIATWSAETVSNAEAIGATLSRVEETEAGIKQAKTDIGLNADGLAGVISDVETIDGNLSSLTTEFNIEAGRIDALVTETDGMESTLAQLVIDVDGIETTVAANDEWLGTYGSAAEQTIEGFEQKVWQADIVNPNMLSHTDITKAKNFDEWDKLRADAHWVLNDEWLRVRATDSTAQYYFGAYSPYFKLIQGEKYTVSFEAFVHSGNNAAQNMNYVYMTGEDFANIGLVSGMSRQSVSSVAGTTTYRYQTTFVATTDTELAQLLIGTRVLENGTTATFYIKEPKIEMGERATPYKSSFSALEQRADDLSLRVANLSSLDGEEIITQSDIVINPDNIRIGSRIIGDAEFASIFSVSPQSIDVITENLNLTGNLNVKGKIESLAVSAVTADFAEIFADIADIGFIKGDHIDVNTITVDHLTGADAILELLMARSIFSENVTTIGIEAIYADLRSVNSEIMTSNIIKSDWLDVDTALFDRFTADEAFIDRLVVKAANIRELEAITIDAVQANLTTVMNSMGEVEGGLTIRRPDGVVMIQNGLERFGHPIQLVTDIGDDVTYNHKYYETNARGAQQVAVALGSHAGRYANFGVGVGMRGDADWSSTRMAVVIRPDNIPPGASGWFNHVEEFTVYRDSGMQYVTINYPTGRPTYGAMSFTIEFYRIGDSGLSNPVQLRLRRSWVSA